MGAKAAWLATKENATPRVLQALAGYATAVRRIGQGTGPNATRYRRDAREAMLDAAGAGPRWVLGPPRHSQLSPADRRGSHHLRAVRGRQGDPSGVAAAPLRQENPVSCAPQAA